LQKKLHNKRGAWGWKTRLVVLAGGGTKKLRRIVVDKRLKKKNQTSLSGWWRPGKGRTNLGIEAARDTSLGRGPFSR